ncbi:MAG: hypothetical protein AB1830_05920 [Pseudomonadota bacterium]
MHLAYATRYGLGVLIPAENPQAQQRLQENAARWLEARGWKAEGYHRISALVAPALLRVTRVRRCGALAAPGNVVPGEETLQELLRAIPCPMLIAP